MGYGISAYAVRLAEVERVFGSRDADLYAKLLDEFDHEFDSDECDEDDEDEPTLAEALREMIEGEPMREWYGHKYGYALEILCRNYGKWLPNSEFTAMRNEWIDEVDRGLIESGIPEETLGVGRHITFRGSPVVIPRPEDWPSIGFLKLAEIIPALRALEVADLTALNREVKDSIEQLRGWLETSERSGCDLVCFYY
jgi:hypothetical protein